jgi:serine protease AprX
VIVTLVPGAQVPPAFARFARGGRLDLIHGQVLDLPNRVLARLAASPEVFRVHYNRPIAAHNHRTRLTVGADRVQQTYGYGYTGAGVGVAVIDSGIAPWHDDLTGASDTTQFPYGNQRVRAFVDFVNGRTQPYDDHGHGTHVAGIIGGNGYDSFGEKGGIAPEASLVVLKVLDAQGQGTIGSIIAALGWVAEHAAAHNIRVVNLSVGAGVEESYWTDPLTLATKRLTDQGIVVVAAAGNRGLNAAGQPQWGGILAPGNAPWVLTVGATSTQGTTTRSDDTLAPFSSAGPTYLDYAAKPDLVAPGTGTVSLAVPGSTLAGARVTALLPGVWGRGGATPYLSLSGTSMAAPVVSGTVALMLQANPALTPNLVKAILQYTAEVAPAVSPLKQGGGFLNTWGAVRLARFYATAQPGMAMPSSSKWSRQILWGNHPLAGGYLRPKGNAWQLTTVWGSATTQVSHDGDNIVWGTLCGGGDCDNIVWGTADEADNIVWGTVSDGDNIVWGTVGDSDNIVWGTLSDGDNIVWGTAAGEDNIVWGTDCGGGDCDNIVWGTADADNIVWGTAAGEDNIVWGTAAGEDNIVWGTAAGEDNIVWGTAGETDVVFPDTAEAAPDALQEFGDVLSAEGF